MQAQLTACVLGSLLLLVGGALAEPVEPPQSSPGANRSPFIDSIPVGSEWRNVAAEEGKPLRIHAQAMAFSGGGTANGRTVVLGGGHNNGMNDAVAILDWRRFETVGWVEELISTADLLGVEDHDYAAIGKYQNEKYNPATPGGILDSRGLVALSRHTYDQVVVRDNELYMFGGILPYNNSGQPKQVWPEGGYHQVWRYDFGKGWSFITARFSSSFASAAQDTLTGNIWVHSSDGLHVFDTSTETMGRPKGMLRSEAEESFLNFNPEKGRKGVLIGGGQYAEIGNKWSEYDMGKRRETVMGPMPGTYSTYIFYVHSAFGPGYGTYFAMVPSDGTLRRWNGSGWDTIVTGGNPTSEYAYGRAGFEEVHQIFYWINNPPEAYSNEAWETWVVRPYPYHDDRQSDGEPAGD